MLDGLPAAIREAIRDYADSVFILGMTDDAVDDATFTALDDTILARERALVTTIARAIARGA